MTGRARVRRRGYASAIVASLAVAIGATCANAQSPGTWPDKVDARYSVTFAGLEFGKFVFSSQVDGAHYRLGGHAKLSAFFGAFRWRGGGAAEGTIRRGTLRPVRYDYRAKRKRKKRVVSVRYQGGNAVQIDAQPPIRQKASRVTVEARHKRGVLDPLTAIMAFTGGLAKGADPCSRKLAIFDGRQRLDITLTPKGWKRVRPGKIVGMSRRARVCRVQYTPIAGHRKGKENAYMQRSRKIEVWLVPVQGTSIYVPYRVTVPTFAGTAVLQAETIRVRTAGLRDNLLVN